MSAARRPNAKPARKAVKPKPKTKARAKPALSVVAPKEEPAMPDIGRPTEPPEAITGEAYRAGAYELQPQHKPAPVPLTDETASLSPETDEAAPDASESLGDDFPGDLVDTRPPEPLTHVRMIHDDPDATADPYPAHPRGGIVVPLAAAAGLKSAGFRIEHEHEIQPEEA